MTKPTVCSAGRIRARLVGSRSFCVKKSANSEKVMIISARIAPWSALKRSFFLDFFFLVDFFVFFAVMLRGGLVPST